jgi:hypothetical protein
MLRRSFTTISFPNSKNKNLLDILDDIIVDECKQNKDKNDKNKNDKNDKNCKICKSCDKIIYNKNIFDIHQEKCFLDKIEDLINQINVLKKTIESQDLNLKTQREDILHELRVKYLELMIENNNNKWNKLNL